MNLQPGRIAEGVLIVLGIAAFWPAVFGYMPPWLIAINVIILAGLVWVTVRRVRRFKKVIKEQREIAANIRQGQPRP